MLFDTLFGMLHGTQCGRTMSWNVAESAGTLFRAGECTLEFALFVLPGSGQPAGQLYGVKRSPRRLLLIRQPLLSELGGMPQLSSSCLSASWSLLVGRPLAGCLLTACRLVFGYCRLLAGYLLDAC